MVDLDRDAPSESGERARGFLFPDPTWRHVRGGEGEPLPASPFTAAVLFNSSARMVPVVRRRGRQPPALV